MTRPRILMVSKFRQFQGGVERHIDDLSSALRNRGYDVQLFSSEDVVAAGGGSFDASARDLPTKVASARNLLWNGSARKAFAATIASFSPDLVHFHSIYHQLSPSLLGVFSGPQLMTLHDYKLAAPCYSLFRDNQVCVECVGRRVATPAITHRCISGSVVGSTLCVVEDLVHRRRYEAHVDRFIVPSEFSRDIMMRDGLPEESVAVIPWGVSQAESHVEQEGARPVVSYVGRLHATKGVGLILDAWARRDRSLDIELVIAGSGEMQAQVRAAAALDPTISYRGVLTKQETAQLLASSALALVPSLVPETMGLVALEALTAGTPIVSSDRGALHDLVGPGTIVMGSTTAAELAAMLYDLFREGGTIAQHRRSLAERDLSLYSTSRMVDAIEGEYGGLLRATRA